MTHFFTQSDRERLGSDLRPAPGGWWMRKPPLEVPEDTPPAQPEVDASAPEGLPGADANGLLPQGREPRERMEALRTALD